VRDFRAFSLTHTIVVITFALFAVTIIALGLHWRNTPNQRRFERALGIGGLMIWIITNAYGVLPHVFTWRSSLPLHVCDLAALTAPFVLLRASPARWLRGVLYFAGIGLCTQAFITPILREGPTDPQFWGFWGGHFIILSFATYDVIVRRWRPTWRDWGIACVISLTYLGIVLPLDIIFGWNYGFVGPKTQPGTVIEVLGPWPWRVVVIVLLVAIAYTMMMLPWAIARRWRLEG
jgi:hypothetical integral membrane protein (TIGR02206 family)